MERWVDIPGWTGLYQVSNLGRVRSLPRVVPHRTNGSGYQKVAGCIRKQTVASNGYLVVSLSFKGKISLHQVHALVMLAFKGPYPPGMEIRHRDGNRLNPRLGNLRYATPKRNAKDKTTHGTEVVGVRNGQAKLTEAQVRRLRRSFGKVTQDVLAARFNISTTQVSYIGRGLAYPNVV